MASPSQQPCKQRAQSVGTLLEPWVEEFAKYGHARVSYNKPRTGPQVATIEFVLSAFTEDFGVSHDDVATLREALDVLHVAALHDVHAVEEALSGLCYHDIELVLEDDDDQGEESNHNNPISNGNGDAMELQFVLTFYGAQGRFLEQVIAPSFFTTSKSRSANFHGTRDSLMVGNAVPWKPMQCRIGIVSLDAGFADDAEEDYMERIVSFIRILDNHGKQQEKPQDNNNKGASEPLLELLVITGIDLELNELTITPQTAQAVDLLEDVSIPVRCSTVAISPRLMKCSAEVLSLFLDRVGAQSSSMTVSIGHVNISEPSDNLDDEGENLEELIHTIFRGIAGSACVTGISFGPLLALMATPSNRKAVWTELFQSLMAKEAKATVTFLGLSPQIQFIEEDAESIREAAAADIGGRPLQVKSVSMWLSESPPEPVQAFIKAVGSQVETISLCSEPHTVTHSDTVTTIIHSCPQLTALSLMSAEIENMCIFTTTATPLRELSLNSIEVKDLSSVSTFLAVLAHPTTPLAKEMLKLHIKMENNAHEAATLLGASEASVVRAILRNNKTLRDVELTVNDDTPTDLIAAIQKYDREVLADPLLLAQKLAFVSAIQPPRCNGSDSSHRNLLDHDVVQTIFDFAAERISRHVYVDW